MFCLELLVPHHSHQRNSAGLALASKCIVSEQSSSALEFLVLQDDEIALSTFVVFSFLLRAKAPSTLSFSWIQDAG